MATDFGPPPIISGVERRLPRSVGDEIVVAAVVVVVVVVVVPATLHIDCVAVAVVVALAHQPHDLVVVVCNRIC